MTPFLINWLAIVIAVAITAKLLPSEIQYGNFENLAFFAVVLGLLNAFVAPIVRLLTFPINILTLGLFSLVINALMFWLAATWSGWVSVDDFGIAFIAALIVSVTNLIVGRLLR